MLYVLSEASSGDSFNQLAGIYLLNSLACQVDTELKMLVGSMGAVEQMLDIISEKLSEGSCDYVMENVWSTMWNVTDEAPGNCCRFLAGGGIDLFLQCKERFPDETPLLGNMIGLLGNIAEVPELRPKLMTGQFVEEVASLLDCVKDSCELSYTAAGVLAHLLSDGVQAWTIHQPEREEVLENMSRAISSWDMTSKRKVNYRTFEPVLRLLRVKHTPQCRMWAVWALANLTSVTQDYCGLVLQEGGIRLLEEVLQDDTDLLGTSFSQVTEWADVVRSNVLNWQQSN